MERSPMSYDPMARLTDDILVDILSRVPYKSSCCCKCVSTRWRGLFSHPDHRKKLPWSLAGFFHEGYNENRFPSSARYFTNVTGQGDPLVNPSLSFLPGYSSLDILDCCNGLLLCRRWKATDPKTLDYVVCNPATERWVLVPATEWSSKVDVARLGFEPSVAPHFHVFEFIDEEAWGVAAFEQSDCIGRIQELAVYSSKAGVWKHQSLAGYEFAIPKNSSSVFLNGLLHLSTTYDLIVAVDVEASVEWIIDTPMRLFHVDDPGAAIFPSQGQLFATISDAGFDGSELAVWVLEDINTEKWTLKHNVSHLELFGSWYSESPYNFSVISIHPERNMIFIVSGVHNNLMSYDMDRREMHFICQLGRDCQVRYVKTPYIPLFSESLADGHA